MVGGTKDDVAKVQPIFDALRPPRPGRVRPGDAGVGFVHAGPVGAGHFSKMVHNGIEYAMMQAYGEGYELLAAVDLIEDVPGVIASWTQGTVIRSWLLDLLVRALHEDPELERDHRLRRGLRRGPVDRRAGIENAVPMPTIAASLFARFVSRQDDSPTMKAVAALRKQFGGHAVHAVRRRRPRAAREDPLPPHSQARADPAGRPFQHLRLKGRGVRPAPAARLVPQLGAGGPRAGARVRRCSSAATARARPTWSRRSATWRRMSSHRVSADAPLVRHGDAQAVVRAALRRGDRELLVEIEINPGRANRVRVNRAPLPRPRELLGMVRTVLFAPEDLALVRGDPTERRRFLDELLVTRTPRLAGVRADYDRVLKQRNALLKTARLARGKAIETLDVWDGHLTDLGGQLLAARLRLVADLAPAPGPRLRRGRRRRRPRSPASGYSSTVPLAGDGAAAAARDDAADGRGAHRGDARAGRRATQRRAGPRR